MVTVGRRSRRFLPLALSVVLCAGLAVVRSAEAAESPDATAVDPATHGVQTATGGTAEAVLFYLFGGTTLLSALAIALSKRVVRMAVWLFVTLGSVAVLYFLMAANFVGAIQLIVYVGGTLVLLIFGVMLTTTSPWVRFDPKSWEKWSAGAVCVLLLVALAALIGQAAWPAQEADAPGFTIAALGKELLTTYLVPFEVASVLLLVVMIGAAYLARQD